jgi:hypothetical protein
MSLSRTHNKTFFSATVFLAIAVVLGGLIVYDVAGYFATVTRTELAAAQITQPTASESGAGTDSSASAKSAAQSLKAKNLFVLPAPKEHPVKEVTGILGEEALIGGQWYKAGDHVEDAEVLAVEPTLVRVRWDGREQEFSPIAAAAGGGTGSSSGGRGGRRGGLAPEELARRREAMRNASPAERQRLRQEMRERLANGG